MGLIPDLVIEQVLSRTDILQTVGEYVTLKRTGNNYKGLCPFHGENSPSFFVHPSKGIFKCFGCGAGGNVVNFLMTIEGWNFPETVRHLADKFGIEIAEESDEEAEQSRRRREGKKLYLRIMTEARAFFEQTLEAEGGRAALHYLRERDIDAVTSQAFGLGYAPQGWQNLFEHLVALGHKGPVLERAGLVIANNKGGYYDRFRHRVVFPVVDIWGNTLAFGARALSSEEQAKYINSPETPFYKKGEQLYGLDQAKKGIQKAEFALLVEGNFDVISLHGQGLDMAIAPMGTALTDEQARLLARYTKRVVIAFDGDQAGQDATLRCMSVLERAQIETLVIQFDELDDPDSFIRRHGPKALHEKIADAVPLVAWALDRMLSPVEGASIERKLVALKEASELLADVHDTLSWEHYAQEISRRLAIEPRLLREYLKRPKANEEATRKAFVDAQRGAELENAEYGALVVLLDHPEWLEDFFRDELDKLLCSQELAEFLERAHNQYGQTQQLNGPMLLERIDNGPLRKTVERAMVESATLYAADKSLRWYQDCVRTLKKNWANRTLDHIMLELERVDFRAERARYEALNKQREQVNRFKTALDLEVKSAPS
ncbi:MAG: DNA primase [Bradymonadaceae bacterium]|nr:DNA primase [Lujinxingiaceae bacterium]